MRESVSRGLVFVKQTFAAGALYFMLVFALGFVLGTVRTLVLVPGLGELAAVVIELPLILVAAWLISRWLIHRLRVPATAVARVNMGLTAFVLLMTVEYLLSVVLFDIALEAYVSNFLTAHGALGLAGQALFACFPVLQLRAQGKSRYN